MEQLQELEQQNMQDKSNLRNITIAKATDAKFERE